jgi:HD-GYP domain-containing protein (c-di-GMP phosphodiesterase class II)
MELVSADAGSVMLLDPDSRTMRIAASVGLASDMVAATEVSEGEGVSGWVLATGQPMAIEDLDGASPRSGEHGVRSAISVPLADSEGVLGVLNVARSGARGRLSRSDMEAIQSLGRFSAIVLRRARLASNDRERYFGTLTSLASAMEAREPGVGVSTQRVAELAVQLGAAMDVEERVLDALRTAALLHDVGMAAAGDTVNVSERPLSTFEWGMLKMHPLVAVDILEQVPALADVVPIVRHHHEHWDGSGYVAGLAAEQIPIGARILAVADAFVAMTSERPYRKALSTGQALAEMSSKAGSQFDPVVVRVLAERFIGESDRPA